MITQVLGRPGVTDERQAVYGFTFLGGTVQYLHGGKVIDGAKARNANTTGSYALRLPPGMLMGKITSGGRYAPSIVGVSTGALTATGTTLTVSAAQATEIVRRFGATGTFKLTGPPAANGTVRTLTVTYSAVNTTTGEVTITALGVNEVQTVNLVTAGTAGNLRLLVPKPDGTIALTPNIAWSATDATLLSNANTALDTATGVVGGLIATAIAATDTDLGMVITFAGAGYAGLSGPTSGGAWPLIEVHTMFTSNTGANVVRTTSGVTGAFAAGSFVQPADGSETPITLIPDGTGILLASDDRLIEFPLIPVGGQIYPTNIQNWPSDTSLRTWIRDSLSTSSGGKFTFSDKF